MKLKGSEELSMNTSQSRDRKKKRKKRKSKPVSHAIPQQIQSNPKLLDTKTPPENLSSGVPYHHITQLEYSSSLTHPNHQTRLPPSRNHIHQQRPSITPIIIFFLEPTLPTSTNQPCYKTSRGVKAQIRSGIVSAWDVD